MAMLARIPGGYKKLPWDRLLLDTNVLIWTISSSRPGLGASPASQVSSTTRAAFQSGLSFAAPAPGSLPGSRC